MLMSICLILLFLFLKFSTCERRITNGSKVDDDVNTSFMVYMVAAEKYLQNPAWPGWLCSGSIIHTNLVLTSAACLSDDVRNIYVISGYRKYVQPHLLEVDECTKRTKRKIISYCSAKHGRQHLPYRLSKSDASWTKADIAIARVMPPFDFLDLNYLKYCSYFPNIIGINFQKKYEEQNEGVDVIVFGWGHTKYFRQINDTKDYNVKHLQWARSRIVKRWECLYAYLDNKEVRDTIENVGICTRGRGNLNANGSVRIRHRPRVHGCRRAGKAKRQPFNYKLLKPNTSSNTTTKSNMNTTMENNCTDEVSLEDSTEFLNGTNNTENSRRNGICQNDHGAPLVIWVGGKPHVIGVASAFLVKPNMQCVGPYVYSSVRANSRFINCVLEENKAGKAVEDSKAKEDDDEISDILDLRKKLKSTCDNDDTFQMIRQDVTWVEDVDIGSDLEHLDDYDLE